MANVDIINKGMSFLRDGIIPYLVCELENEFGTDWWYKGVIAKLRDENRRNLPENGDRKVLQDSLDVQHGLLLFDEHWFGIFRRKLPVEYRNWAKEACSVCDRAANKGANDFNYADTWRALDTLARLCDAFSFEKTEEIRSLFREFNIPKT